MISRNIRVALSFTAAGARLDLVSLTNSSMARRWSTLLREPFGLPAGLPLTPFGHGLKPR
jgi:hypothetical protein